MKRKAKKYLSNFQSVLVRDATDERYPWLDPDDQLARAERGRWKAMHVDGCLHDGVHILHRRHFAFIADDGEHWDCIEWFNDVDLAEWEDPWASKPKEHERLRGAADSIWRELPPSNRAWFEVHLVLPYESILDIDHDGDERGKEPHVYTMPFDKNRPPFRPYAYTALKPIGGGKAPADDEMRVEKFPRSAPDLPPTPEPYEPILCPIETAYRPDPCVIRPCMETSMPSISFVQAL
jgi:hypothetical protein